MLRIKKIIYIALFLSVTVSAQELSKGIKAGKVSFRSSQNIYVKFDNTNNLQPGDTLFIKESNNIYQPALIIKYLSSTSAAGELMMDRELKIDDQLFAFVQGDNAVPQIGKTDSIIVQSDNSKLNLPVAKNNLNSAKKNYHGRVSIQSFSSMANFNDGGDDQRWRYSVMFNTEDIGGSPISISNYFIFSYRNTDIANFKDNVPHYLKVYDFAVKYKIDETSELWGGRHLNRKVSNISSIDGLQYEKNFSFFYTGAIVGARPDFKDMSFNFKLFEYGAYLGRIDSIDNSYMENTIAVMEQTNNFITDRRFFYLQHSNNIIKNTNLFFSSEVDLYERLRNESKNTLSLTGLFFSGRYAPLREVSFSLSYDARKDVIYYETYRSFADSIIERETRQGLRGGINLRLFNNVFMGINAGYRFQKSDSKPARNYNLYLSYSLIPGVEILPSASFTKIQSSYIDGTLWGIRLSKSIFDISDISFEYRNSTYKFPSGDLQQKIFSIDISTKIWKYLYLTGSYEGTFEKSRTLGRALFDLTTRF